MTTTRFTAFPRTSPHPSFVAEIVEIFRAHEAQIGTHGLDKGLTSDEVLSMLRPSLLQIGFDVEAGKTADAKIRRPVFFGENGSASLQYEVDAFHPGWRCGLEIEAGRGWMGNAVYRDLVQALVMVEVDTLVLAVANEYKYNSGGKKVSSSDYQNTIAVAEALYGHDRVRMPYRLVVIGY